MTHSSFYRPSDLDGLDPGGFMVLNVNAPMRNPHQVVEDEEGNAYFCSLDDARALCRRLRREFGNPELYIYALIGVREAINAHPGAFIIRRRRPKLPSHSIPLAPHTPSAL